uniref:Uncharacterized protein n=1 Tax=Anopheles farauti TaxID=69004 RepID=A0A182QWR6_9DIPT
MPYFSSWVSMRPIPPRNTNASEPSRNSLRNSSTTSVKYFTKAGAESERDWNQDPQQPKNAITKLITPTVMNMQSALRTACSYHTTSPTSSNRKYRSHPLTPSQPITWKSSIQSDTIDRDNRRKEAPQMGKDPSGEFARKRGHWTIWAQMLRTRPKSTDADHDTSGCDRLVGNV